MSSVHHGLTRGRERAAGLTARRGRRVRRALGVTGAGGARRARERRERGRAPPLGHGPAECARPPTYINKNSHNNINLLANLQTRTPTASSHIHLYTLTNQSVHAAPSRAAVIAMRTIYKTICVECAVGAARQSRGGARASSASGCSACACACSAWWCACACACACGSGGSSTPPTPPPGLEPAPPSPAGGLMRFSCEQQTPLEPRRNSRCSTVIGLPTVVPSVGKRTGYLCLALFDKSSSVTDS